MRDPEVERRYHAGELSHELLTRLHDLLGGTPRFLTQMRDLLRTISPEQLEHDLDAVHLPAGAEESQLQKARDKYCEEIITARLYGYLSAESRRALTPSLSTPSGSLAFELGPFGSSPRRNAA